MTLSRGGQTGGDSGDGDDDGGDGDGDDNGEGDGDDGGDGGDVVHAAGSDGDDNGDDDDDDDGGDGIDVVDGAGIMLTRMVQLHLAKASGRVEELFTRKYTFFLKRTVDFFTLYNLWQRRTDMKQLVFFFQFVDNVEQREADRWKN